jgi:hypothetical protein
MKTDKKNDKRAFGQILQIFSWIFQITDELKGNPNAEIGLAIFSKLLFRNS